MATFKNSTATGNTLGGFYTNNPYSIFDNCLAQNNAGFGFKDDSGEVVKAALLQSLSALKKNVTADGSFTNQAAVVQEITALENEVQKPAPEKGFVQNTFERIKDLTKEHLGEAVAQTVYQFATKGPEILQALHSAGILS
jgi:hypothetical protein